jgi:hypothetical protein
LKGVTRLTVLIIVQSLCRERRRVTVQYMRSSREETMVVV